jgi:hypothetical protein
MAQRWKKYLDGKTVVVELHGEAVFKHHCLTIEDAEDHLERTVVKFVPKRQAFGVESDELVVSVRRSQYEPLERKSDAKWRKDDLVTRVGHAGSQMRVQEWVQQESYLPRPARPFTVT